MAQVRGSIRPPCALERLCANQQQQHAPIGMARGKERLVAGRSMPAYGTDLAHACIVNGIRQFQSCCMFSTLCVEGLCTLYDTLLQSLARQAPRLRCCLS